MLQREHLSLMRGEIYTYLWVWGLEFRTEGWWQACQEYFFIMKSVRASVSFLMSSVVGKLWTPLENVDVEMVLNFYICKMEMSG